MGRSLVFAYGVLVYGVFLVTFLYAIGFVGNWIVPKSIDTGSSVSLGEAICVNVLLLALFAIQHTIMARPAFKLRWARILPQPIERSTFVLLASLLLGLAFWQWRPIPETVWQVDAPAGRVILNALSLMGWIIVLYGSFLIDHFDLFGLRQVFLYLRGKPYSHPPLKMVSLYRFVRHPLMLGFLIAFWATPSMTQGHLLFAVVTTAYIFFGIQIEERDLQKILGDDYRRYREETSMIVPMLPKGGKPS